MTRFKGVLLSKRWEPLSTSTVSEHHTLIRTTLTWTVLQSPSCCVARSLVFPPASLTPNDLRTTRDPLTRVRGCPKIYGNVCDCMDRKPSHVTRDKAIYLLHSCQWSSSLEALGIGLHLECLPCHNCHVRTVFRSRYKALTAQSTCTS